MKRERRVGDPVKLYYDSDAVIDVGDVLRTPTGTTYLIQTIRVSPSIPHRRYLGCVRWTGEKVGRKATIHPLIWYARKRKGRR